MPKFKPESSTVLLPGDIMGWNNINLHKTMLSSTDMKAIGATILRLPPYSLDFNPITITWSFAKDWATKGTMSTRGR